MGVVWVCGLALCLACLVPTSAGLDWRDRLLAAENSGQQQPLQPLTLLVRELDNVHPCNVTSDCCEEGDICRCEANTSCFCFNSAYWQKAANACVRKGELGDNCTDDAGACLPQHSSCQPTTMNKLRLQCSCDYPYYPDKNSGLSCIWVQSPFFTTTIIISICILFCAVAIGVVMQIRSNMQRRLYQQQYRRHADLDAMLAAQRRARQRRAAQRRANPTRRYSDEAAPDEPPPPYVPIFTTRSSGDWGKLPSYQEAVADAPARDNEAFEIEEGVFTGTEEASRLETEASPVVTEVPPIQAEVPPIGAEVPPIGAEEPPAQTVTLVDRCHQLGVGGEVPAPGAAVASFRAEVSEPTVAADGAVSPRRLPQLTDRETGPESLLRRTGSI